MNDIDIAFETLSPVARLLKKVVINPLANNLPPALLKKFLRDGKSELALANWRDPGGWRSMVISYHGRPERLWDRILVTGGTIPMALRNRRKLAAAHIARLLDESPHRPAHALCLGAGPGHIITDAMLTARPDCRATLVDISSDAFAYGRKLAREKGLIERVEYIRGDVREIKDQITDRVDLVKLLGICEYLEDAQIVSIAAALAEIMPAGAALVCNSLSRTHGTEPFFKRVFGLHMIHRSPDELRRLFEPAGFGDWLIQPEPLGVYDIMVARKSGKD